MRTNFEFSHMTLCLHSLHPQALRSPPRVPTISYTKFENIHDLKCLFWYPEFCFSSDPFATILVPLERGDPCRYFELLHIKSHLCNNEISSIDFGCTEFLFGHGLLLKSSNEHPESTNPQYAPRQPSRWPLRGRHSLSGPRLVTI